MLIFKSYCESFSTIKQNCPNCFFSVKALEQSLFHLKMIGPATSFDFKGLCHEDIAVLGQFCFEVMLGKMGPILPS